MAIPNLANGWSSVLSWALTDVATTVDVASVSGAPARPFQAVILAEGTNTDEIVTVTDLTGSTITITRATEANSAGSTSASAHGSGAVISHVLTKKNLLDTVGASLTTVASSGAAQEVDLQTASVWDITLTTDCEITISGPIADVVCSFRLILRQDGTGGRTVTWPASVEWLGGSAPVLVATPSGYNVINFVTVDNGTTWIGAADSAQTGTPHGTSFPGSPSTYDHYFRDDLGLEFFYDGTRWVTTTLYREPIATQDTNGVNSSSTAGTWQRAVLWGGDYSIYVYKIYAWCYIGATNTGSVYWTVDYKTSPSASTIGSFNTSADAINGHRSHIVTVNAVVATTEYDVEAVTSKTGSPSALYLSSSMTYRIIAT